MEGSNTTVVNNVDAPKPAEASQPPRKRQRFSSPRASGKPERNNVSLVEKPTLAHSQMGIHQTQMAVACDLTSLPACVNNISKILRSALQNERDRLKFTFCHVIAVAYNLWLLVDKQAVNRFGFGPTIASREMTMLHDVTASFVEACSATVLPNGIKLSTAQDYIVPVIKAIINHACHSELKECFNREWDERTLSLESFPLVDVLGEWEVLRAKAARYCGNLSNWRVPDCKVDFSLLAHGIVLDGQSRTSCGISPLPQRLEKVCIALGLVKYTKLGVSSFIPQVIHEDDDNPSLALRCGCFSGLEMTRDQALAELMTYAAPLAKV